jgi:hypothetical protein
MDADLRPLCKALAEDNKDMKVVKIMVDSLLSDTGSMTA